MDVCWYGEYTRGPLARVPDAQHGPPEPDHQGVQDPEAEGSTQAGTGQAAADGRQAEAAGRQAEAARHAAAAV